jgi:hypothetical protein
MECYVRGDFVVQQKIEGIGGNDEKALATWVNDTASASQYVVFFNNEDCNPDGVIENAWLEEGCSSWLPNDPAKDYKSWSVWDMCLEEPGCSMD